MDTPRNTPRIALAKSLATFLLRNSVDKHGQPLINHCLRVHSLCLHLTEDQQIAAILHDCIEDGKLNNPDQINREYWIYNILFQLFGREVSEPVQYLTRYPYVFSYEGYLQVLATYPPAIPIKLADLTDNLDPSRPISDSLRRRYMEAKSYLEECLSKLSTN